MVEETGIRAKLALEMDDESIRRTVEEFQRKFETIMSATGGVKMPTSSDTGEMGTAQTESPVGETASESLGLIASLMKGGVGAVMKIAASLSLVLVAINGIMNAPAMRMVMNMLTQALNLFFMPFGNALGQLFMPAMMKLMEFVMGWNRMVMEHGLVNALLLGMKAMGEWVWNALPPFVQEAFTALGSALVLWSQTSTSVQALVTLYDATIVVINAIWDTIKLIGGVLNQATLDDIFDAFGEIGQAFVTVGGIITSGIDDVWDTAKTWFDNNISTPLKNGMTTVGTALSNLKTSITDLGTTIVNGLQTELKKVAQAISTAIAEAMNFGGNIWDKVKAAVPGIATGGVTTGPTLAMVGEGGEQEVVLPLSRAPEILASTLQHTDVGGEKMVFNFDFRNANVLDTIKLERIIKDTVHDTINKGRYA